MGSRKLKSCEKGGETQEKVVSSRLDSEHLGRNCHPDETLGFRSLFFFPVFLYVTASLRLDFICNAVIIPFGSDWW